MVLVWSLRFDVVLEQDRDAVERAAQTAVLAFLVELGGDGRGIGVEGENRVELGTVAINGIDSREVELDQPRGGPLALLEA